MEFSRFGKRFTRHTGARQLMDDLGAAMSAEGPVMMLGGGNPAHIPEVLELLAGRAKEVAADPREFRRMIADYSSPAGEDRFRAALADLLNREYGWDLGPSNIALTGGSQSGFFQLFNLLAGAFDDAFNMTPLIFVLSKGADPMADLVQFATEMKMNKKLNAISLGQGQGPRAEALITETLKLEEARFNRTLDRGMKLLDEEAGRLGAGEALAGEVAFKLYDTYGFPLDLTQDVLRGQGRGVDQAGFDTAMERQRAAARKSWVGSGEAATESLWYELRERHGATEFLGYEDAPFQNQVIAGVGNTVSAALQQPLALPSIRVRYITSSVHVWDGQTLVLGGLIAENVVKVKDKVPMLGDMPFVGRFFRSERAATEKKNLMIFVSPRIIDPAGNPVHTEDSWPYDTDNIPAQAPALEQARN